MSCSNPLQAGSPYVLPCAMDQPVEVARREAERQKCLIDVNTALDSAGQFFMMGVKVLLDLVNYGSRSLYHLLLIISSIFTVITV